MNFKETMIDGLLIISPNVFSDERGYFMESFNKRIIADFIGNYEFIQDNQSLSGKGVIRGLHFQNPPFHQGKLVRVIKGAVNDVVVDIRKNSSTYGHVFKIKLTESNFKMLWIPPGFAHGFETLEENTIFAYKVTNDYNKESEGCILWDDKKLNIEWETKNPSISKKALNGELFENFNSLF